MKARCNAVVWWHLEPASDRVDLFDDRVRACVSGT